MRLAKRMTGAATTAVCVVVVGLVWAMPALSDSTSGTAGCGTGAQAIVTAGYQSASHTIYEGELDSPEVTDDLRHVTSSNSLAGAVADGDQAVVRAETHKIVYTRHWHIVRLRVLSPSGRVLADVGGPYVLAPVTGQITYHGTVVGRFVMSVQDDLGYEKLVTRFTGLPIELYRNGTPLMGRDIAPRQAPEHLPAQGTPITVSGAKFVTLTYPVLAFPAGQIEVMLAIPAASAALGQASCAEVNAQTYGEISVHVAMLINLRDSAGTYVMLDHEFDPDKLTFVRSGSMQLAGSDGLPGPAAIPDSGSVSYEGHAWLVYSFLARHSTRVYILFPDTTMGGTGASGSTGTS